MPDGPAEITAAGLKIIDLMGACAASPDDLAIGQAADDALRNLEQLLATAAKRLPGA
jgi:hypothetical protein